MQRFQAARLARAINNKLFMIPFKRITPGEKISIARFVTDIENTDDTTNLKTWIDDEDAYYAIVQGRLIFRKQQDQTYIFSKPYGKGPLRYALMQMLEDSAARGSKCVITGIPEEQVTDFKAAMPGHFSFADEGDGTHTATAVKNYSNSVFNNNESMVPAPSGETLGEAK